MIRVQTAQRDHPWSNDCGLSLILTLGIIGMLGVVVGSFAYFVSRSDTGPPTPQVTATNSV